MYKFPSFEHLTVRKGGANQLETTWEKLPQFYSFVSILASCIRLWNLVAC